MMRTGKVGHRWRKSNINWKKESEELSQSYSALGAHKFTTSNIYLLITPNLDTKFGYEVSVRRLDRTNKPPTHHLILSRREF
jgi:hypothetical protein